MMKVLQMLLKSPSGKKAAAALYRSMKKGKGLAQSTKQGIKRDLRPGYKELMGSRGRKPVGNEDILKMYERLGRKVSPSRASMDKSVAEMSKFLKPRHPGTPKGVKAKDAIPGVRAQSLRDRAIRMDLRGMAAKQRGDIPSRLNLRTGEMMKAKPLPGNVIRGVDRFRRPVDARRVPQPPQRELGAKSHLRELEELYNKIAKVALPAQKATRRKPKSLYGKTKKAMKPAYKKMMKLRKRLQEKGLI